MSQADAKTQQTTDANKPRSCDNKICPSMNLAKVNLKSTMYSMIMFATRMFKKPSPIP